MIKEVFLTAVPATANQRWESELKQGLSLKADYEPEGFYLDCGVHQIKGELYYVGIQVTW